MNNSKIKNVKKTLSIGGKSFTYYSLREAQSLGLNNLDQLPVSLKILLENLLRKQDGDKVSWDDCVAVNAWASSGKSDREINYFPARVVLQDFTGVPVVVDLAAMREGMKKLGKSDKINPLIPVDLVIDHSVIVEHYGTPDAYDKNVEIEYQRNLERYQFLKWGQKAFKNFRAVPPGTGIVHQVNLEYLAKIIWTDEIDGEVVAYPDTCVGTDSHTTMINGAAVLGWGVGGIEAEAAMLGQAVSMIIPDVVGFKLKGKLNEGVTATDLVLTVTQMLRAHGVVEKFVEFYGPGLSELSLADRATLANMAPEYGATCGFFPVDEKTIEYLRFTGRDEQSVQLVEAYSKEQGLWNDPKREPRFTSALELDLAKVEACISGPSRPQDRILLKEAAGTFKRQLVDVFKVPAAQITQSAAVTGKTFSLHHGDVVVAAITSCTNTSNPSVLLAAGLVAQKANQLGLKTKPWVKTSIAPGSKVVTDYLIEAGLQQHLDALGFYLAGYGCTTCIGNSGPLNPEISEAVTKNNLVVATVLSGNRNFEGRVMPEARANFLMSPPLVVAYALAGNMNIDLVKEPIGKSKDGKDVFLKDIWPSNKEIQDLLQSKLTKEMFKRRYSNVFDGDKHWQAIKTAASDLYSWDANSTYIQNPPFFENILGEVRSNYILKGANILALLGDSVTTDHISPAGNIKGKGPAGLYLSGKGIKPFDFNSFGSRRGNHEVMMRGTFANIRIKNEILAGKEGGETRYFPTGEEMSIYDASMKYQQAKIPLVVIAGKEYGSGSSRDWAAKGVYLLGVKAVIAESFERIHRSNLVGMGVLPLLFPKGVTRKTLGLKGDEKISLIAEGGENSPLKPKMKFDLIIEGAKTEKISLLARIDTAEELEYFKNGGILQFVLRKIAKAKK